MKFSINADFLYQGKDIIESIKEIKRFGFDGVEICFMFDKTDEQLEEAQKATGIEYRLFMTDVRIGANDPRCYDAYIADAKAVCDRAVRFGSKNVIVAVGGDLVTEGISREEQLATMIQSCKELAPYFEERGVNMLIEPINNKVDHVGCGLWSADESYYIIEQVGSPNVKMLYDIYHMQIMEGNVTGNMLQHLDVIEHVHCAGCPGRQEVYNSELDYHYILKTLKEAGYQGTVGIEFNPRVDPKESLPRIRELFADLMD